MRAIATLALGAVLSLTALCGPARAQAPEQPNLMIVFDGSGSMWGQVGGRAKIELARQALSSVLSEATAGMQIGMLAYGHRVRGQCNDIELMVPTGPAGDTVPRILDAANRMNPRGMTPLTDAVLIAAQRLAFGEQAATVVLLTDGIETCGGDPCALGRLLAREGIDFRAHVVGFDLSDSEQRQVSCLAEETGGMFLAANDADELRAALARTLAVEVGPDPVPEPEPVLAPRDVTLILRDVAGGPVLSGRPFRALEFQPLDEAAAAPGQVDLSANPGPSTGRVALLPGSYRMIALRETEGRNVIRIALPVEIPQGAGPHVLDLVIAARLDLQGLFNAGQPLPEGLGRLPRALGQGWAEFAIHPVVDDAIDAAVDYGGNNSRSVALPPGEYFVRGVLSQMLTRERLVSVAPGVTTAMPFDFQATAVSVDLRDAQGFALDRYDVRIFDGAGDEAVLNAAGRDRDGPVPFYLAPGSWRIVAEGNRQQAETVLTINHAGPAMQLNLRLGQQADGAATAALMSETATRVCLDTHRGHGCVVEAVTPLEMVRHLGLNGRAAGAQLAPRFTGTWQTHGGMMALVQDGRRVWGEVHVNGGIGLVWGHVAPDGLTLRAAMDRSSSPRGVAELRIDPQGETLSGNWDHNIGRMGNNAVTARRLSGGVPPLARATGTDDDLRIEMSGRAWAPADSAEFAAFMALARAPASPDTGEDIDAMQFAADPVGFTGTWNTNHQLVTLRQEGREVHGHYRERTLWGQVSADGTRLRGIWSASARDWGLFEFRLNADRSGFDGAWGRAGDTALAGGAWTGQRRTWLVDPPPSVIARDEARDPGLAAFFAPVQDPDLPGPATAPGGINRAQTATGADTGVIIGSIETLPPGIYGMVRSRPGQDLRAQMNAVATDPALQGEIAQSCATEPRVIHADGLIAIRMLNSARAQAGGAPYSTDFFTSCEQNGPILDCRSFNRPLADRPDPNDPDFRFRATVATGPAGVVALDEGDGNAMIFRSCLGPAGFLDAGERAPSGRLIVEHIADREDGGESPVFDARGTVIGQRGQVNAAAPASPPAGAPVNFSAAAGLYANPANGTCAAPQAAFHPDGVIAIWNVYEGRLSELQLRMACGADGECRIISDPPPPPGRDRIRVQSGGPGLQFCAEGAGCVQDLVRCDAAAVPPTLAADLMRRPWDSAAPTPAPAPAPDGAGMIPAGLWHVEAPWSDPMPAPGTPAFAERCFDEVSVTFPDGLTIGLNGQETAQGPEYFAGWSEQCRATGDALWPVACMVDDANVADAAAATVSSRIRLDRVSPDRVEMTQQSQYDPAPERFVLHACVRPDGTGLDLAGDPRGRALARAVATLRDDGGPGLDLAALQGTAPVQAPAPGGLFAPQPATPAAPAARIDPSLAGLWFAIRDGRAPAALSADEVATSCFEAPVRFHDDGVLMVFAMGAGMPRPDSHMRCAPAAGGAMDCGFHLGTPGAGQPEQGRVRMGPQADGSLAACMGPQCLTLARCPAPDWSPRERASGLAASWEAAVEARE